MIAMFVLFQEDHQFITTVLLLLIYELRMSTNMEMNRLNRTALKVDSTKFIDVQYIAFKSCQIYTFNV